jgi:hypothetical protein
MIALRIPEGIPRPPMKLSNVGRGMIALRPLRPFGRPKGAGRQGASRRGRGGLP